MELIWADASPGVTSITNIESKFSKQREHNAEPCLFGAGSRMQEIQADIARIGESDAPILIQGETGVGKEVLVRHIHARSQRAAGPFRKVNCAALPKGLVESELFGYERGAFTGAVERRIGLFEAASGGVLLLDEIGDMDLRVQAKLLHVLQDNQFQRVGGSRTISADVRIIAATHRDLERAILQNQFREDLYYRLNVIRLELPPLRERANDIPILIGHFMRKHGEGQPPPEIPAALWDVLMAYDWPGNIRELENVTRRYLILRDAEQLASDLATRAANRRGSTHQSETGQRAGSTPPDPKLNRAS